MQRILFLIIFSTLTLRLQAAEDSLALRIILIGDAGELDANRHHPVVEAVKRTIPLNENTKIVYLGDNLYRHGLPYAEFPTYNALRAVLDTQANIADGTDAQIYFIPGNHDWSNGAERGLAALRRQERYLNSLGKKNLHFLPKDGCPGPEVVDLGNDVLLLIMDSQWWVHKGTKPDIESDCDSKTKEEIVAEIGDILNDNREKLVIFAAHHPFKSNGIHGGFYTLKQHIFPFTDLKKNLYLPLPVLGSLYPIVRGVFGTPEDLSYPEYENMINDVDVQLQQQPYLIHTAGHEHNLQWIQDSSQNYIVSGSGSKSTRVSSSRRSKFVTRDRGFVTLDIYKNKDVRANFYALDNQDSLSLRYTDTLFNYSEIPVPQNNDSTIVLDAEKDSVLAPLSVAYEHPKGFQKFIAGQNYRKIWSEPVPLRIFKIKEEEGGMKITGAGGGQQTKSLHLKDSRGTDWKIRTIDKDPEGALPPFLRNTFAKDFIGDMISAAYPYAPLIVPVLADAGGVIQAKTEFMYVPDDPALGHYRKLFARKVIMLSKDDAGLPDDNTKGTAKIFNKMREDNDHVVNQNAVLRARLLDWLIGDWDRHFDQWHWVSQDTGKGKIYYPIPRDRDQAFFKSNGAAIWLASRRILPWMKGFGPQIKDIEHLGRSARDFDRIFLNSIDRKDWEVIARDFAGCITDTVIHDAVSRVPDAVYDINGPQMEASLRSRRDALVRRSLDYYDFISKTITVLGSNDKEYFTATTAGDKIKLDVYLRQQKKEKDTTMNIYSREIDPAVTKEVRIFGFNGDDIFTIDSTVNQHIKFRLIGGRGADTFNITGNASNYIYDLNTEKNIIAHRSQSHLRLSSDPAVNDYQIKSYEYPIISFPRIIAGINGQDGVLLGTGFSRRTFGFRKEPYSTDQSLTALMALATQAYQLQYNGTFIGLYRTWGAHFHAEAKNPALDNFFGYGNNTILADSLNDDFYRARYKYVSADAQMQRQFASIVTARFGPTAYHYWYEGEDNTARILEQPERVALDSQAVTNAKTYLGGKMSILVNNLNNPLFPTRGVSWITDFTALGGLNGASKAYTMLQSNMTVYASLSKPARVVAVIRLGYGHIFSKNYEYFQALAIGNNNYLRGFDKNRFAGRSMAHGSLELRVKVLDVSSKFVPGSLGVLAFDDVGRVWQKNQSSNTWHNALGGGLYYTPFNLFLISGTVAVSPEHTQLNITFGTSFNLTF